MHALGLVYIRSHLQANNNKQHQQQQKYTENNRS